MDDARGADIREESIMFGSNDPSFSTLLLRDTVVRAARFDVAGGAK
jgi:hypothetical protein